MENDNKMEAQRQQFVLFGKLIAFIPLSVVALVYSWNFIASKYHSPIADFSLPVLYFILASIFGFYFPRVLFIVFIIFIMTFFLFLSFLFFIPWGNLGPIPAFVYAPASVPISLAGCFLGKLVRYLYDEKMNSPRLNTK